MHDRVENRLQVQKRRENPRDFMEDSDLLFSLFQSSGDRIDVLSDFLFSF